MFRMKHLLLQQLMAGAFLAAVVLCADSPTTAPSAMSNPTRTGRIVGKHRVITFPDVRDETTGIAAEHAWTKKQFPGYEWNSRKVLEDKQGRVYHRVLLVNSHGGNVTVYFDVTSWYDRL
jgi:hypothetical protein